MKFFLSLAIVSLVVFSCNNTTEPPTSAPAFDAQGYELEAIPGTDARWAVKIDAEGKKVEEGILKNGFKEGTWIEYHIGGEFPSRIMSFIDGKYNGPYMEYNERGQLSLRATYRNNKLHGSWGKYSFGRPEVKANYKDGELDGTYIEYDKKTGKVQKEVNYKKGKQHGMYRFYNPEGEITVEYEYKNGEKVSGGITGAEGGE